MTKKYEFTDKTIKCGNKTLRQIRRLSDGLVGGYIESENNLSHEGNCFVYENAKVLGNARIRGNAFVTGNARIQGNAFVTGNTKVSGNAFISENSRVFGNAQVSGNAFISGNAKVYGNVCVSENAQVSENAEVFDNALVSGKAKVYGYVEVFENAVVDGDAEIHGYAQICENVPIKTSYCYQNIVGSRYNITVTKDYVKIGCETLTWDNFKEKATQIGITRGLSNKEIKLLIEQAKSSLKYIKLMEKENEN